MGRVAGLAMAGEASPYNHLSLFYSDLFELGYEAAGEMDSRMNVGFQVGTLFLSAAKS
jgi:3-phenylpropionate/trans-cinnamate dioxygenase ferredoxin reductase component